MARRHCGAPSVLSAGCVAQRLIEIGDKVVRILDPDRQAHHVRRGPCGDLLRFGQLAVRG